MAGDAWEAKLKEELWASKETIQELAAQTKEKDKKITKADDYATFLEVRFVDATSKGMILESQADTTVFKQKEIKVTAREVEERVKGTEANAWVAQMEAALASTRDIKDTRNRQSSKRNSVKLPLMPFKRGLQSARERSLWPSLTLT